jgi:hypothetical protein
MKLIWPFSLLLLLLSVLIVFSAGSLFLGFELWSTYALAGLMLLVCLSPVIIRIAQRRFDLWELINPLLAIFFVWYGMGGIFLAHHRLGIIDPEVRYINLAMMYTSIGILAFVLGYLLPFGKELGAKLPPLRLRVSNKKVLTVGIVCYLIGFVMKVIATLDVDQGHPYAEPSGFASLANQLALLRPIGLGLVALYIFSTKRPWWGIPIIPLEICVVLITGMRADAILPLIAVLVIYSYICKRSPIPFLAAICIAFVLTAPLKVLYWKEIRKTPSMDPSGRVHAIGAALASWHQYYPGRDYLTASLESTGRRISTGLKALAIVIRDTPSRVDFLYGGSLLSFFYSFLPPRIIFPEKPQITAHSFFMLRYRLTLHWDVETCYGIALIGELFANLHLPAVILGLFILGAVCSSFYTWLIQGTGKSPCGVYLYALGLVHFINIEANIGAGSAGLVRLAIFLIPVLWLIKSKG